MNRREDYKDVDKWRKTCNAQRARYYARTVDAINSKTRWQPWEDEMILKMEVPDKELSRQLGMSMKAIIVRRCKLKAKKRQEVYT